MQISTVSKDGQQQKLHNQAPLCISRFRQGNNYAKNLQSRFHLLASSAAESRYRKVTLNGERNFFGRRLRRC